MSALSALLFGTGQTTSGPPQSALFRYSPGQSRLRRNEMGYSHYDAAVRSRAAWNAGKTVGTKRPLMQKQIWAIRFFLDREGRVRDRTLFDLAIDSKLRGCDLVKIKTGDLVTGPEIRKRAMVVQQKTGRPVQFELTSDVRGSLLAWLERRGGTVDDHAFPSRINHERHMTHGNILVWSTSGSLRLVFERREQWQQ